MIIVRQEPPHCAIAKPQSMSDDIASVLNLGPALAVTRHSPGLNVTKAYEDVRMFMPRDVLPPAARNSFSGIFRSPSGHSFRLQ